MADTGPHDVCGCSYTHAINTRVLLEMGVTHVLNVHTSHRFRDSPFTVQHIPISDYGASYRRPFLCVPEDSRRTGNA